MKVQLLVRTNLKVQSYLTIASSLLSTLNKKKLISLLMM